MRALLSQRFVSRRGFVKRSVGAAEWPSCRPESQTRLRPNRAPPILSPTTWRNSARSIPSCSITSRSVASRCRVRSRAAWRWAPRSSSCLAGNYVCVLDPQGARLKEIALSAPARCAAVGRDGTVYVSCAITSRCSTPRASALPPGRRRERRRGSPAWLWRERRV